jgi:hypothetical protein
VRLIPRTKPTPSFVVACLALVVAGSGTAWAAVIDGHDIAKRSIPGNRLVKNGVTGVEVKEGSLATVPNARTVNNVQVKQVSITSAIPATGVTKRFVMEVAGLRLVHGCDSGGNHQLLATASTVGILKVVLTNEDSAEVDPFVFEDFNVQPADGTMNVLTGLPTGDGIGELVWQAQGPHAATLTFHVETNSFGAMNCTLGGTWMGA